MGFAPMMSRFPVSIPPVLSRASYPTRKLAFEVPTVPVAQTGGSTDSPAIVEAIRRVTVDAHGIYTLECRQQVTRTPTARRKMSILQNACM